MPSARPRAETSCPPGQEAARRRALLPRCPPVGRRDGMPTPASSVAALGVHIGAEELFAALSDSWAEFRGLWDNGRGFGEIRRLWLERAAGLGQAVAIQSGGSTVEGTFDTIDESGCMVIRTSDGRRVPISAGGRFFCSAPAAGGGR